MGPPPPHRAWGGGVPSQRGSPHHCSHDSFGDSVVTEMVMGEDGGDREGSRSKYPCPSPPCPSAPAPGHPPALTPGG